MPLGGSHELSPVASFTQKKNPDVLGVRGKKVWGKQVQYNRRGQNEWAVRIRYERCNKKWKQHWLTIPDLNSELDLDEAMEKADHVIKEWIEAPAQWRPVCLSVQSFVRYT